MIKLQYGMAHFTLRLDRAGEYTSQEADDYYNTNGILPQYIPTGAHSYNGEAETKNKTLMHRTRGLLIQARMPAFLWDEGIHTANTILNSSPIAPSWISAITKWDGSIPDINDFTIFGAKGILTQMPKDPHTSAHGQEV
jgi:hypothetical protein